MMKTCAQLSRHSRKARRFNHPANLNSYRMTQSLATQLHIFLVEVIVYFESEQDRMSYLKSKRNCVKPACNSNC